MYLTNGDVKIVWAALQSVVNCDDAPWDKMTDAQWSQAAELIERMSECVPHDASASEEQGR